MEGTIKRIFTRSHNGKKLYSFAIEGIDDKLFGTGDREITASVGDSVKFEIDTFEKKYPAVQGDITVVRRPSSPSNSSSSSDSYSSTRDASIKRQSAFKDALVLANIMLEHKAIALGNAKASDKYDMIVGHVWKLAETIEDYYMNGTVPENPAEQLEAELNEEEGEVQWESV